MKKLPCCCLIAVTVLATQISSSADSAVRADAWHVLGDVTHKRTFTIETRDHRCVSGRIDEVAADHLTAKLRAPNSSRFSITTTFARTDVLRVMDWWVVYYSGRSSWSDVSSLRLRGREPLEVVTKAGKTYKVKPPFNVSNDGITISTPGGPTTISKSEIAKVYGVVAKPLTDFRSYSIGELGPMLVFDPDWYAYGLHLEHYIPVLLYDGSEVEDNSDAKCMRR
jgi:hypothetical protein